MADIDNFDDVNDVVDDADTTAEENLPLKKKRNPDGTEILDDLIDLEKLEEEEDDLDDDDDDLDDEDAEEDEDDFGDDDDDEEEDDEEEWE